MLESKFKTSLKKRLEIEFPGCIIMHLDPTEIQGIPDLIILWRDRWATLEGKRGPKENVQPNQKYYVEKMDRMSFSAFIWPGNVEEVINDLKQSFKAERQTRLPKRF